MRHWCNKAFFNTVRVVIFANQIMLMAPLVYQRDRHSFRTHAAFTCVTLVTCLLLLVATPYLLRIVAGTYGSVSITLDALFVLIAMVTQVSDAIVSLLLKVSQMWQRQRLCNMLNLFTQAVVKVSALNVNFIDWRTVTLLALQLALALYELLLQLVFLIKVANKIGTWHLVANLVVLYLQQCQALTAALVFASVLLLRAGYQQLERSLEMVLKGELEVMKSDMQQLVELYDMLHALGRRFTQAFQFPVFLLLIGQFINVLANLYAQIYYYVTTHGFWYTFIFYCAKIGLQMYLLIYVAQSCVECSKRVRYLWLNRDYREFKKELLHLTHSIPLWPPAIGFPVLGMFELNNDFWLFLVSYSVNFIVIILQFGYEKTH